MYVHTELTFSLICNKKWVQNNLEILCYLFVSGQHPDVNACVQEIFDGLGNSVLKLVFDACRSDQRQVAFNLEMTRL